MTRFRYLLHPPGAPSPTRKGRWLGTREEAVEAAIKAGLASRDSYSGAKVFFSVGVEIEERRDG